MSINNPSWFQTVLLQWAFAIPYLLIYLAGIFAAAVFWRRCPTASALALAAMVVLLLLTLLSPALTMYFIRLRSTAGWDAAQSDHMMTAVYVLMAIAHAAGLGLLVWAVFQGRQPSAAENAANPYPPTSVL